MLFLCILIKDEYQLNSVLNCIFLNKQYTFSMVNIDIFSLFIPFEISCLIYHLENLKDIIDKFNFFLYTFYTR